MNEITSASQELAIFVPSEDSRGWEERIINPPTQTRRLGSKALKLAKERRIYEYTDAIATITLVLDHLLR